MLFCVEIEENPYQRRRKRSRKLYASRFFFSEFPTILEESAHLVMVRLFIRRTLAKIVWLG